MYKQNLKQAQARYIQSNLSKYGLANKKRRKN